MALQERYLVMGLLESQIGSAFICVNDPFREPDHITLSMDPSPSIQIAIKGYFETLHDFPSRITVI